MAIGSAIAVYLIIWWTLLFAILPFRIRSQQEAGDVAPGSDPGAPAVFHFGWYIGANTIVSGCVFALFWFFVLPNM